MKFAQYSVVRIARLLKPVRGFTQDSGHNQREPQVGDKATIVEVYIDPPGYELECCTDSDGITTWLHAFNSDAIELELIDSPKE